MFYQQEENLNEKNRIRQMRRELDKKFKEKKNNKQQKNKKNNFHRISQINEMRANELMDEEY